MSSRQRRYPPARDPHAPLGLPNVVCSSIVDSASHRAAEPRIKRQTATPGVSSISDAQTAPATDLSFVIIVVVRIVDRSSRRTICGRSTCWGQDHRAFRTVDVVGAVAQPAGGSALVLTGRSATVAVSPAAQRRKGGDGSSRSG